MSQASKLIPVNIFESISGERVAELTDLRLPSNINSCIRLQPKGFASDSYFVEDNVIFKDEKGIQQTKTCPVTSFIRWRYAENKDQIENTNVVLVTLPDGHMSLIENQSEVLKAIVDFMKKI